MFPPNVPVPQDQKLTSEQAHAVLATDVVAMRIMEKGAFPEAGDLIGVRLNLNVLRSTGVAMQTLHRASNDTGYQRNKGFYKGEACGYAQAVHLKNAYFNVQQSAREAIATGKQPKTAMASIDGELVRVESPEGFEGVEVRFNPRTDHLFVDQDGYAIQFAEEVVVLGHRAYAKGVQYHTDLTMPPRRGTAPSTTKIRAPELELAVDSVAPSRRRAPRP
jgi:hypothetical protein